MKEIELEAREHDVLPEYFELNQTETEVTGLRLFSLKDTRTDVTVTFAEFNDELDVHNLLAYAGARTSRSEDLYTGIFETIVEIAKENPGIAAERLKTIFVGYGHKSVADMAPMMLYIDGIPMLEAFNIFNHTSVGAGQELSSRYVKFTNETIPPISYFIEGDSTVPEHIETEWSNLQTFLMTTYEKWLERLEGPLAEFIAENNPDESMSAKRVKGTVETRTKDVARTWLPLGIDTKMTLQASAGAWAENVVQMRGSLDPERVKLAEQIEAVLNLKKYGVDVQADFSGFTKYTDASGTIRDNLDDVERLIITRLDRQLVDLADEQTGTFVRDNQVEFYDKGDFEDYGEAVVFQALCVLYPNTSERSILTFLRGLDESQKSELGYELMKGHHDKDPMRNIGDIRGPMFSLEVAVGYLRDFNRHRAMGRLVVALETDQVDGVMKRGFAKPRQLATGEYWDDPKIQEEWEADVEEYYTRLIDLYDAAREVFGDKINPYAFYRLLPLGHRMRMHFSGPISQFSYFLPLRSNLGGDYGYRDLAERMKDKLRASSPYLSRFSEASKHVDPNDAEQLLGRS